MHAILSEQGGRLQDSDEPWVHVQPFGGKYREDSFSLGCAIELLLFSEQSFHGGELAFRNRML